MTKDAKHEAQILRAQVAQIRKHLEKYAGEFTQAKLESWKRAVVSKEEQAAALEQFAASEAAEQKGVA